MIDPGLSTPTDLSALTDDTLKKKLLGEEEESLKNYDKHHSLSLAYCSWVPGALKATLIHGFYSKLAEEKSVYDLVLVTDNKPLIRELKPLSETFAKIELVTDEGTEILESSGEKTFRIFYKKNISFQDMQTLQKLTRDKLTTGTGDQSLSEMISKGAPFFYLTAGHKFELWKRMQDFMWKNVKSEKLLKIFSCYDSSPGKLQPPEIAQLLVNARHDFKNFCEITQKRCNLGKGLCAKIKKILGLKNIPTPEGKK